LYNVFCFVKIESQNSKKAAIYIIGKNKAAAIAWIHQLLNFVQFDHKWYSSSVMT